MFKCACLIKKNTKTLRKKLEGMGYKYHNAVKYMGHNYDNLKEPYILCLYDSYILLNNELFLSFLEEFNSTPKPEYVSNELKIFNKQQEEEFLKYTSIEID